MYDALIELVRSLFTQGISWGGLIAFLIFLGKVQRADKYKEWNRDVVNNQRKIMEHLGVGDHWSGHIETLWNEEAQSLKKRFLLSLMAINLVNQRRKKKVEKLKSRKLWMAVVSAALVIANEGLNLGIDTNTVLAFAGIIMSYIFGQAYVDGKQSDNPNKFM